MHCFYLFFPTRFPLHLFIYVCNVKWKIAEYATDYTEISKSVAHFVGSAVHDRISSFGI